MRIVMPAYACAKAALPQVQVEARLPPMFGIENGALLSSSVSGLPLPVYLVDAPQLFEREGLYQDQHGRDWDDNARRFAYFAHAASFVANGGIGNWIPQVVHANDWHTGLLPLLIALKPRPRPATVFTIHNLAFQGNFPKEALATVELPDSLFTSEGIEFYGQLSFMKAGIQYSDRLTTVSPTYAEEILTPAFGCGMEGLLRQRADVLCGILNGIDIDEWNPVHDI